MSRCVRKATGFTLVELLVVVSIIAMLLALLTPALEAARTQAKLAVCSVNLKTVTAAAALYAQDHRNFYPQRHDDYMWDALHIRAVYSAYPFDLRPQFQPYMSLESFIDPLLGGPKLDDDSVSPDSNLLSSFNIYADLKRGPDDDVNNQSFEKMERLGQRFEAIDSKSPGGPVTRRFGVFAGDRDMYGRVTPPATAVNFTASSHPDKASPPILRYRSYRDVGATKLTFSEWVIFGAPSRAVDLNFAYVDGSVRRYTDVVKNDPRMARIVSTNYDQYNGSPEGRYDQIPRE